MEAGNFKSSVNSNVALHYFVSLRFDWSRKPASYYKIQTVATIKPITTWLPAFPALHTSYTRLICTLIGSL